MNDALLQVILTLGALAIMAYYEVNRKFKLDKAKNIGEWIGIHYPRILFTIAIVPGAGKVFLEILEKLIK